MNMRNLIFLILIHPSLAVVAREGQLDTTFGNNGVYFRPQVTTGHGLYTKFSLQSDDKILAIGQAFSNPGGMQAFRFLADTRDDVSFNSGQHTLVDTPDEDVARASAQLPDGKILVVGNSQSILPGTTGFWIGKIPIIRLHPDGTLDESFGDQGGVIFDVQNINTGFAKIAVQSDGKFMVIATSWTCFSPTCPGIDSDWLVIRFLPDGDLDTSFGDGKGYVRVDFFGKFNSPRDLKIRSDNRLLITGGVFNSKGDAIDIDVGMVQLRSDGSEDNTFGNQGRLVIDSAAERLAHDSAEAMQITPENKIVLAGTRITDTQFYEGLLWRLNSNGSLDSSFGDNGLVVFNETKDSDDVIDQMVLQPDGKYLLLGRHTPGSSLTLWRFHNNGVLDTCFGVNGWTKTRVASAWHIATDQRVNLDGTLTVVARTSSSSEDDLAVLRYVLNDPDDDGLANAWQQGSEPTPVTPDRFCFVDRLDVQSDTQVESNKVVITGIESAVPVSVGGGEWQRNNGVWTAAVGVVQNGDVVRVRHRSAASTNTQTTTSLNVGGISASFRSTTANAGNGGDNDTEQQGGSAGGSMIAPLSLLMLLCTMRRRSAPQKRM